MYKSNLLRKFILWLILIHYAVVGISQNPTMTIQQQITAWQTTSGFQHASVCIAVSDQKTGEELFVSEPQLSLVPASILKVVTTATALEVFGPDFRFLTTLAYSGTLRNDTLFGDLQIIGGGDPTLGSMYFPENNHFKEDWIKAIQDKHIKVVTGNLIADASIYESQMIPDTWIWEDIGNYYGAGASGISVYDNLYEIHLKSDSEADKPTRVIRIIPEIPHLELQNEVLSSDLNSDQAYVFGSPLEYKRIIRGTIPKNKTDFIVKASIPDPAALFVSEFREKLSANGILVSGENRYEKAKSGKDQSIVISVNKSPALRDIIRVTNHESVNLFAEHLLKHLAYQAIGLGTTKEGCKFVVQYWKDKEIDMTGFFINDGSGLSRFNAITANQMVTILNYMKTKSVYSEDFFQSLATVGNGTLTGFSLESFPKDCLHAKSGSMTRTRCFAGYLNTISGKELTFTIMLNNFSCSQAEVLQKIEDLLAELRKL